MNERKKKDKKYQHFHMQNEKYAKYNKKKSIRKV